MTRSYGELTGITIVLVAGGLLAAGAILPVERAESSAEAVGPAPVDPVGEASAVEITEWAVPWAETRPRDPYPDGQGRIWFVGQRADYVAYLDPSTGEFRRYDLEPGAGPHTVIVDSEDIPWYAGNRAAHIGKIDPSTGEIVKYETPQPEGRDPHTMDFDPQGLIWFSVQGGNSVGRLDPATGDVEILPVPTPSARPYGLVVAADGRPWFTEFGTNKLGAVDPESMEIREYELPREETRPRRLALTSDGAVWYVDFAAGYLGRLDPASGDVQEWRAPADAASRPYAMASDDRDRLWFVETGPDPNRLVGFDPETEEFFSVTEIESGGGAVRHMVFHAPNREIWFGTDANTVGRARLP